MKKVLLSLAVVFVMLSFTTTSIEKENNEKIIEEGLGRDCVDEAMGIITIIQINEMIFDPNDDAVRDRLMAIYHQAYEDCYYN